VIAYVTTSEEPRLITLIGGALAIGGVATVNTLGREK
jgi:drug/metabolite transporter (DMT)-like permease